MRGAHAGPSPTLATAREWAQTHPDATADDLASYLGVARKTASRWHAKLRAEGLLRRKPATPEKLASLAVTAPRGTPAVQLPADQREAASSTVQTLYRLLRLNAERLLAHFEADPDLVIGPDDQRTMAALRALQQTATGLVDAHPGLLAMTETTEGAGGAMTESDLATALDVLRRKGDA